MRIMMHASCMVLLSYTSGLLLACGHIVGWTADHVLAVDGEIRPKTNWPRWLLLYLLAVAGGVTSSCQPSEKTTTTTTCDGRLWNLKIAR